MRAGEPYAIGETPTLRNLVPIGQYAGRGPYAVGETPTLRHLL